MLLTQVPYKLHVKITSCHAPRLWLLFAGTSSSNGSGDSNKVSAAVGGAAKDITHMLKKRKKVEEVKGEESSDAKKPNLDKDAQKTST